LEEKKVGGEAGRMRASVADDDIRLSAALGDSFYSIHMNAQTTSNFEIDCLEAGLS
jgi:hypothetical protein